MKNPTLIRICRVNHIANPQETFHQEYIAGGNYATALCGELKREAQVAVIESTDLTRLGLAAKNLVNALFSNKAMNRDHFEFALELASLKEPGSAVWLQWRNGGRTWNVSTLELR